MKKAKTTDTEKSFNKNTATRVSVSTEKSQAAAPQADSSDRVKIVAVVILAVLVIVLFYYFSNLSTTMFVPGTEISAETFKDTFASANNTYIVMDVRGVTNEFTSRNILQCGVDFAGSSGMGGKNATYFSVGDEECTAPDGKHPYSYCFSELKNGLTIYVREGIDTKFYTNGMVVGVGPQYTTGTCGIRRV